MHIEILDINGEILLDENDKQVCFYNVIRPNQIFESYIKHNYPGAVSWKEKFIVESGEELKRQLRTRRNKLLSASDWTQISDCGLSDAQKEEWRLYRQVLRELPEIDFVGPIIWPVAPDGTV